jgi:enamine deaminase RidA (YjgF/YER057c/UK114 family)
VNHGAYRHLWGGYAPAEGSTAWMQMTDLFERYAEKLQAEGCQLENHCLRTWIFVQNIDVNYGGVVKARNEVFHDHHLTPQTHFIASTGICGRHADPKVCVMMDTYAVKGIRPEQVQYLYAPTHLNPTYEYGVSFERGTCVKYGDRRQVFISGTASINNRGEVVYPGDIRRQTERMWENVEALLAEAECDFSHVGQMTVYLRDLGDYAVVKRMFDERFPHTPKVILLAPVCRPGWLIEMECMAVKSEANPAFDAL